jgi:gliding motility-associated-like protein
MYVVPHLLKKRYRSLLLLLCAMSIGSLCRAQPTPAFTANVVSGCAPLIVQFQDLSTGGATSWEWDLGNGPPSFQQNPSTTYFFAGTYTVKLKVENAAGKDSITKVAYIVVNDVPTVDFTVSSTSGCYPLTVQFTDMSVPNSGTNVEWTWDFGDGNTSNLQSPQHTYVVAGNFGVTLRVKNSTGCFKFLNKPNYINITGGALANFSVGAVTGCGAPSTIAFANLSIGTGILAYEWDFGDGSPSSFLPTPVHIYQNAGTYAVRLITSNNQGCRDTLIKTNAVVIQAVEANFTRIGNCQGAPAVFTNTSTPAPLIVSWDFGDGTGLSSQLSPQHIYQLPGTYQVTLIANFGVCNDTTTKSVTILAKPTASFLQSATGTCLPPLAVNFVNTSGGAVSYQWLFGDGGTSPQTSPSHNYTQAGNFDISLIATNSDGCTDTVTNVGGIKINQPNILSISSSEGLPYSGCAPYTSNYSAAVVSPDPLASAQWDFGDGTPVQPGFTPTHTYTNVGSYSITVIVVTQTGCRDTFTLANAVKLSPKPHANFSATPTNACAIDDIHFTDLSTGTIDQWNWTFGDGGSSTLPSPIYNYNDTGSFTIMLVVSFQRCRDTLRIEDYIFINPPIANFNKISHCDTPFQRRFVDLSKGANTYVWDFDDGTFSNLPSPVHVFPAPGGYKVKLTVTNGSCTHSKTDTLYISNPSPDFTTNGSTFCKYSTVTFTPTNVFDASINSYSWFYGDGDSTKNTSGASTHSYISSGDMFPSMITVDVNGCADTVTKQTPISIFGPKAGFDNPPGGTCINGTLAFIDTSSTDGLHSLVQWIWDYGDGTKKDTLSAPPFAHQYTQQGNFDVKLTITDSYGCYDTLVKHSAVLITKPVANFNTTDTIRCSNSNVTFNNLSQGVNLTYLWNFGDTTTSTTANPQHPYTDTGTYSIKLIITDLFGCTDSMLKPQYVHVSNVKADYSFLQGGLLGLCYPFVVEVNNESTSASSISWSFGDGGFSNLNTPSHIYNYVGIYPLTLRTYGYGGCVDSITKNIEVHGPTGTFSYAPLKFCRPDTVTFTAQTLNNASFVWDFNDGVILTTSSSVVQHEYAIGGLFKPKMILVDSAGCQVPILGADTIVVVDIETHIKLPQTLHCDSVHLDLLDSTIVKNDVVSTYLWSFGDGTSPSNLQHPQHFYSQPGDYVVKLTVTSGFGCTYTDTLSVPINIVQTPVIKMDGDSSGCVNSALTFVGTVVKSDTSAIAWNWTFNNGNTSTLQNPVPQVYMAAGTYPVTVMSSNASGCADTVRKNIIIHPLPLTNAGLDSFVCRGQTITLTPSGAATYVWNADTSLSCLNCQNPIAKPDSIRYYRVTGYSSFGCSYPDSLLINVIQPFALRVSNTDTLCVGESTQLIASGTDRYSWTPVTGLNNPSIANPVASPTATTTYRVSATDYKNCFTLQDTVRVTVYPMPQFNIVQSLIKTNVGNQVPLVTTSSADITKWRWLPATWLSCANCPTPVATIKDNIKYVAEASNPGGCFTRDEVTIETICSDANIFIPNTFSPNADGNNDIFYPRGKGLFTVKSLRIFNRWGEVVFSKDNFAPNDPSQGWDGTFKGVKLSSDVYVYAMEVLCDNSQVLPVKGNLTLLR